MAAKNTLYRGKAQAPIRRAGPRDGEIGTLFSSCVRWSLGTRWLFQKGGHRAPRDTSREKDENPLLWKAPSGEQRAFSEGRGEGNMGPNWRNDAGEYHRALPHGGVCRQVFNVRCRLSNCSNSTVVAGARRCGSPAMSRQQSALHFGPDLLYFRHLRGTYAGENGRTRQRRKR